MVRLSRKTMLAVEAVTDIAFYGRSEPIQAKDITARQGVPPRYLEQVMQQLVHEGVLKGVRGPRGGYMLARERRRISVGDIVRIVSALDTSDELEGPSASILGSGVIGPFWQKTKTELLAGLDSVTIADLCDRAEQAGLNRERLNGGDYSI